jgi:hypothetical protein
VQARANRPTQPHPRQQGLLIPVLQRTHLCRCTYVSPATKAHNKDRGQQNFSSACLAQNSPRPMATTLDGVLSVRWGTAARLPPSPMLAAASNVGIAPHCVPALLRPGHGYGNCSRWVAAWAQRRGSGHKRSDDGEAASLLELSQAIQGGRGRRGRGERGRGERGHAGGRQAERRRSVGFGGDNRR